MRPGPETWRRPSHPFWALPLGVLALWLALVLPSLDRSRLQEVDELTHARTAQGAVLGGHWWPLVLDGRPFYEKPPLMLWLGAATAEASGQPRASWPYRLWPCLGSACALACLALIGLLLDRPGAGLLAALALALQGDFVYHARFFTFDTLYAACALGSLALALRAVRSGRPKDWLWAGAALGLGAAFKSWFVLALVPAYACALWGHLPRDRRARAAWSLAWPPLLVLLAWIAVYVQWNGWGFLREEWSNNLIGRIQGRDFPQDPQGHAAFYLKWVLLSCPAVLPWVLAAPLALGPTAPRVLRPGARDAAGARALAFCRTWLRAFCLSWVIGLACVRAETMNYVLPLEAGLCLAAGLLLTEAPAGAARSWPAAGLLFLSLLAALSLGPAPLFLSLGAAAGLVWLWARPSLTDRFTAAARAAGRASRLTSVLLGLALVCVLGRVVFGLLTRPLDPNRPIARLLLAHPARRPGEPLLFVAQPTQAPSFYSSYRIVQVDALPAHRPDEACLVKTVHGWIFFPDDGGAPDAAPLGPGTPR